MSDDLAYDITKVLFDGKERLAAIVPSAESLDPKTGAEGRRAGEAASGRAALLRRGRRVRRASVALAAAVAALAATAPRRRRAARVVVRTAAAGRSPSCALPRSGALRARPTATRYYRAPAVERFRARAGGASSWWRSRSPSEAVLDYYELEGARARRGATAGGRCARRGRRASRELALAATALGRRTLVAGGRRTPLWRSDGRAAHLRIAVAGGERG